LSLSMFIVNSLNKAIKSYESYQRMQSDNWVTNFFGTFRKTGLVENMDGSLRFFVVSCVNKLKDH